MNDAPRRGIVFGHRQLNALGSLWSSFDHSQLNALGPLGGAMRDILAPLE